VFPSDPSQERFAKRLKSHPFSGSPEIGDDGLRYGAGTILIPMARDADGASTLALDKDGERLLALLSAT
jgi:hypothetical protein